MNDHDPAFDLDHFPFLPGVDLFLWLRIVLGALALVAVGTLALL